VARLDSDGKRQTLMAFYPKGAEGKSLLLRLSPTIITQDTRLIYPLGSATGKRFHTYI